MMGRWAAGLTGLLLVLALAPAAALPAGPSGEPAMTGVCGPDEEAPGDPARLLMHRGSHVPALDLCAGWITPVWTDAGGTPRLAGLQIDAEVAGDLDDRPPLSWFQLRGRYDRAEGTEECTIWLSYYDRPPGWEPFNVELRWQCDRVEDRVGGLTVDGEYQAADLDPSGVRLEGTRVQAFIPFEGLTPWARALGDDLAAAGELRVPTISSGVHGHLPHGNPPPVLVDQMVGGSVAIRPPA